MARKTAKEKAAIERAIALLQAATALEAVKRDLNVSYTPSPKQAAFHADLSPYRVVHGSNRGGKSYCMAKELRDVITGNHPHRDIEPGEYVLFVLSRDQVSSPWTKYLLGEHATPGAEPDGFIRPEDIARRKNGSPNITWDYSPMGSIPRNIKFANGSELKILLFNDSRAKLHLQGRKLRGVFFDEAGQELSGLLPEALLRLPESRSANPHAGFIVWVGTETTVNPDFDEWIRRGGDPAWPDYTLYHFEMSDNPAISNEVMTSLARDIGEDEAALRIYGTSSAKSRLLLLPQFDETIHVLPAPYCPTHRVNIWASYDPGTMDAAGIDIAMVDRGSPRRMVIVKSIRLKGGHIDREVDALLEWLNGRKLSGLTYDHNKGNQRERGKGMRLIDLFLTHVPQTAWASGEPHVIRPKHQIEPSLKILREFLRPPPHVYHEPKLVVDYPTPENGLHAYIYELRNTRLKDESYLGRPIRWSSIHPKANEAFDNARYLCQVAPIWTDQGENLPLDHVPRLPVARLPEAVKAAYKTPEQLRNEEHLAESKRAWAERKSQIKARKRLMRKARPW